MGGVEASSITVDSQTQMTATWTLGVPVLALASTPEISFVDDSGVTLFAVNEQTVENSVNLASQTTSLECSFAGGCLLEVGVAGLATAVSLNPEDNYVTVCDTVCKFNEASSTSSSYACNLPPISTAYSDENFGIGSETHSLQTGRYFGTGDNYARLFDSDIVFEDQTTSGTECFAGMEFREGFVGMLSQVKYFMGDVDNKEDYAGFMKF